MSHLSSIHQEKCALHSALGESIRDMGTITLNLQPQSSLCAGSSDKAVRGKSEDSVGHTTDI